MAMHMAGILAGKRRQAEAEIRDDFNKASDARAQEMESRFFEMAPVAGEMNQAAVDAVIEQLKSQAGFTDGLADEMRKTLEMVPLRFWVVDNSASMLAKELIPGGGGKRYDKSRWDEMRTILSFFADLVEALGARTDIHFLNQPGATDNGLLDIEEFQALFSFFTGNQGAVSIDPVVRSAFEYYDVNSSKRLSAAELLPALRDLLPVQGQHIDMRTASAIMHKFNVNHSAGSQGNHRLTVGTKPVGDAVLDLGDLPEQFLTLAYPSYPSLPAYGLAAQKGELLRSLGPKPTLGTPLHLRLREIIKMVELVAPALRQRGHLAAVVIWTDGVPSNKKLFSAAVRELQALPTIVTVRLCTNSESVIEYYDRLDLSCATRTPAPGTTRATLDVVDDLVSEAREVLEVHPWLTYAAPVHMMREFGIANTIFDKLDEHKMTPEQLVSHLSGSSPALASSSPCLPVANLVFDPSRGQVALLHVLIGDKPTLPEPDGDELEWPWAPKIKQVGVGSNEPPARLRTRTYSSQTWAALVGALQEKLASTPMVLDPVRGMARPWVELTKLSVAYGPNLVLRVGGAKLPKNAFVVAALAPSGAQVPHTVEHTDDALLGSTEKVAMAGKVDLSSAVRIEIQYFAVHSHNAADVAMWPELRLPQAVLAPSAHIVLHVFAWAKRDPFHRTTDAKPKLVGTTAPLAVDSLLGDMKDGTDLSLGKETLRLDVVSERTALEQDLRDKAASEAVATESRRREAAQLPRGWTLDKDVHGRTVYISPPGHKGHAKGRQFYSRPEGFGEAGSSVCVLL